MAYRMRMSLELTGLDSPTAGDRPTLPILPSPFKRSNTPPFTGNDFIDKCLSHDHIIIIASFLHRQGMNALSKTNKTVRRRLFHYEEQMGEAMPHHKVFFIGGRNRDVKNVDKVTVYDCVTTQWVQTPAMPLRRLESSACVVGDVLYVFGGYYENKISEQMKIDDEVEQGTAPPYAEDERSFVSGSVMSRNMQEGEWQLLEEMSLGRAGMVAVSNGPEILVCGGWEGRRLASFLDVEENEPEPILPLCDCSIYDTEREEWTEVCPMIKPRYRAFGASTDGFAYIMGGMHPNRQHINGNYTFDRSVERFNFFTRRWEMLPPMCEARCDASVCSLDGKIYVFGGVRNIFGGCIGGEMFCPGEHPDIHTFPKAQYESDDGRPDPETSSSAEPTGYAGSRGGARSRSPSPSPSVDFNPEAIKEHSDASFVRAASSGALREMSPSSGDRMSPPQSPSLGPRSFARSASPRTSPFGSPQLTPREEFLKQHLGQQEGRWMKVPTCRLREWFHSGDDDIDDFISRVVILGCWPYLGKVYVMITVGPVEGPVPMVMVFDPKKGHWQRTNIDLVLPRLIKQETDPFSNSYAAFPSDTH